MVEGHNRRLVNSSTVFHTAPENHYRNRSVCRPIRILVSRSCAHRTFWDSLFMLHGSRATMQGYERNSQGLFGARSELSCRDGMHIHNKGSPQQSVER
jgi:hypothetical protein